MRRGQAAMEFLSTYGWALMVVLIAIGALSYFGVLNPSNLLPEKCTMTTGFSCEDFQLKAGTGDSITLFLTNNLGERVTIQAGTFMIVTSTETMASGLCKYASDGTSPPVDSAQSTNLSVGTGKSFEVICDPPTDFFVEDKEKLSFNFTYISAGGRYAHSASGDINANVQ